MYIYVYETLDNKQFIPWLKLWFGLLSHAIESCSSHFYVCYNSYDCGMNKIFGHFDGCHSAKQNMAYEYFYSIN
jgi:hypothetical protein